MCLINCLIDGLQDVWDRNSMRSELIGLGLLNIIDDLHANTSKSDLLTQINNFDQHRMNDENLLEVVEEQPIYNLFTQLLHKVRVFSFEDYQQSYLYFFVA